MRGGGREWEESTAKRGVSRGEYQTVVRSMPRATWELTQHFSSRRIPFAVPFMTRKLILGEWETGMNATIDGKRVVRDGRSRNLITRSSMERKLSMNFARYESCSHTVDGQRSFRQISLNGAENGGRLAEQGWNWR